MALFAHLRRLIDKEHWIEFVSFKQSDYFVHCGSRYFFSNPRMSAENDSTPADQFGGENHVPQAVFSPRGNFKERFVEGHHQDHFNLKVPGVTAGACWS